jgi:hypothetical protein
MRKPKRALTRTPVFETEDEERAFWATHDSTEYVDWSKGWHRELVTRRAGASRESPDRDRALRET